MVEEEGECDTCEEEVVWVCNCFPMAGGRDEEKEGDPKTKAEEEFWAAIAHEKKEIETREKKRQEALQPRQQPTPIPEEGAETPPAKVLKMNYTYKCTVNQMVDSHCHNVM